MQYTMTNCCHGVLLTNVATVTIIFISLFYNFNNLVKISYVLVHIYLLSSKLSKRKDFISVYSQSFCLPSVDQLGRFFS